MNDYHNIKQQYNQTLQEKQGLFDQLKTKFPDINSKEIYLNAKQTKGKLDPGDLAKINTIHNDPLYRQAMAKHNESQKLKKQLDNIPKPSKNPFKRENKTSVENTSKKNKTTTGNSFKKKNKTNVGNPTSEVKKIKPNNFFLEGGKLRPRRALAVGAAGLALGGALLYNDFNSRK